LAGHFKSAPETAASGFKTRPTRTPETRVLSYARLQQRSSRYHQERCSWHRPGSRCLCSSSAFSVSSCHNAGIHHNPVPVPLCSVPVTFGCKEPVPTEVCCKPPCAHWILGTVFWVPLTASRMTPPRAAGHCAKAFIHESHAEVPQRPLPYC
jgi:hypothetical protein